MTTTPTPQPDDRTWYDWLDADGTTVRRVARILDQPCTVCHADPGDDCTDDRPTPVEAQGVRAWFHHARITAAVSDPTGLRFLDYDAEPAPLDPGVMLGPDGTVHGRIAGPWTPDSNVGRWDHRYADADADMPQPYIDTPTYQAGVDWLDAGDCLLVEDWGAGLGWFAHVAAGAGSPMRILGIDGSVTPHAQRQADLAEYRSTPEGLFMRGVAEHNWRWADVLTCAAASFQRRAFVAFFTPMVDHQGDEPVVLASEAPGYPGVPDLALPRRTVERIFRAAGAAFASQTIPSDTAYGTETMYRLWRPGYGPRCADCGCVDHSGDVDGVCMETVADPRPDGEPDQGTVRPCGCPTYTPVVPASPGMPATVTWPHGF